MLRELSQEQFGQSVEQYRRELQAHCYRMTGTIEDSEDIVQEAFLRAWKRRETYLEDVSLRAWLYKIATNICLDSLKKKRRRVIPQTSTDAADPAAPIPDDVLEPIWIDPYPDELLEWNGDHPEQFILAQENVSIAFLAALQLLPPRQRAVLLLSDVLDWSAAEIAQTLDTTVSAVKSALHRARSILADRGTLPTQHTNIQPPESELQAQLEAYVQAWEAADIETFVNLLKADATFSMPPIPSWYKGKGAVRELITRTIFRGDARGRWRLHPTRSNGQIAFGLYRLSDTGRHEAYGIQIVTFDGEQIADIITFRMRQHITYFRLPTHL